MMAMAAAAPRPKSPPASPDPCGRRRLQQAVDALHREIGFLEGEINSIEGIHAASICCKEVDEFIGRNPDPFITISSERRNTSHSHNFLKKFRASSCLSYLSWICCCGSSGGSGCSSFFQLKRPSCCCCCSSSSTCRAPETPSCCRCRVGCPSCSPCSVSCPTCSCRGCTARCPCPCPCPGARCSCCCGCPPAGCKCGCAAAPCCCVPRCCLC